MAPIAVFPPDSVKTHHGAPHGADWCKHQARPALFRTGNNDDPLRPDDRDDQRRPQGRPLVSSAISARSRTCRCPMKGPGRLRHQRPTSKAEKHAVRGTLQGAAGLRLRDGGSRAPSRARTGATSGTSIRSTAPLTSCMACRSSPSPSASSARGRWWRASSTIRRATRCIFAEKGQGAWLNNRRLRVSGAAGARADVPCRLRHPTAGRNAAGASTFQGRARGGDGARGQPAPARRRRARSSQLRRCRPASTPIGSAASRAGTWPRGWCWCARPAALRATADGGDRDGLRDRGICAGNEFGAAPAARHPAGSRAAEPGQFLSGFFC